MPSSDASDASDASNASDVSSGGGGGRDSGLTPLARREAAFRARFPLGSVEAEARELRGGAAVACTVTVRRRPRDAAPVRVELALRTVGAGEAVRYRSLERVRELAVSRALAAVLGADAAAPAAPPRPPARVREPDLSAPAPHAPLPPPAAALPPAAAQVAALLDAAERAGLGAADALALRERLIGGAMAPGALERLAARLRHWVIARQVEWLGAAPHEDGGGV